MPRVEDLVDLMDLAWREAEKVTEDEYEAEIHKHSPSKGLELLKSSSPLLVTIDALFGEICDMIEDAQLASKIMFNVIVVMTAIAVIVYDTAKDENHADD